MDSTKNTPDMANSKKRRGDNYSRFPLEGEGKKKGEKHIIFSKSVATST